MPRLALESHAAWPSGWMALGVDNLGPLELAKESPLFSWAEAPRTWRVTLRAAARRVVTGWSCGAAAAAGGNGAGALGAS